MRKTTNGVHTITCDYQMSDDCPRSTTIDPSGIRRKKRAHIRRELTERGWDRSTLGDVCANCRELLEQEEL